MRHPRRPTCRDDFEIAVICALPLEYDAVAAVLDGYWNNDGDIYGKVRGDQNTYTTGWINQHNVVLVLLPNIGKVNATSVARSCSLSFTQVKLAFLVGVCGAVPQTKNGIEIVLGDVVIAEQILEYDLGRRYSDGLQPKENLVRRFTEQNRSIRGYMATMQTERYRSILPERAGKYLKIAQECHPAKYDPPQQEEDKLYSSLYRHKHHAFAGCDICNKCATTSDPVCDTALNSTCEQLGCDDEMLVQRKQTGNSSDTWWPVVHWGTVASADTVMKSAVDRDTIARKYDIIGFEMEGAGTCDSFPCIVIKGACDYADSHKNKKWQNYAAITAACVMKALLTWYSKADSRTEDSSSTTVATNEQLMVSSTQVHHSARGDDQVFMIHESFARIQKQNEDLRLLVAELKMELPAQVSFRDLVEINDALGQTYSFPLSFVDSFEFFVIILKHKFKAVGTGKIDRGEWLLQNNHTGHVLDLKRSWKEVVKAGQVLDMSMIFKKRNKLSTHCPWCNFDNNFDTEDQQVQCRKCSGKYRRIEVVYDIIGWKDHQTGDLLGSTETNGPQLPEASRPSCSVPQQRSAEDDEIHSYTRVQILDLKSPVDWLSHSESTSRECQMVVRLQDSEDISRFIRHLVRVYHLPEQYCRDAVEEYHGELFTSTRRISGTFDFPNISPEVSTARDVDITNFEIFDDFLSGVLSWPGDDLSMEDSKFGMCDAIHPKSILSSRTIAPAPSYARFLSGDYPFLPPNNFEQQLWESSISYFHWLTSSQTAPSDSNNATDTISLDHVATPPMTSDANVAVLPVSEITSFQTFRERHSEIQPPLDFERNCPILASEVGNKKRAPSLARPETNPRKRLFKPSSFQSSPSINTRRHFVDSLSVPVRPASYCPPQAMSAEDTGKCLKEPDWLF